MAKFLTLLALAATAVDAASIKDIKHVVMLMMENRSFQHYFGTMAGVRGFADPNVQVNDNGRSVWYQNATGLSKDADYLLPFYLNHAGDEWSTYSQCLCAGANNWIPTQQAFNGGKNDMWAKVATPQSWGYFKRKDVPFHFALADAYTVGDAYFSSITANTDPNRWFWQSGTINVPGGKQALGSGGVVLDNNQVNGCDGPNLNCLPLQWPAFAEYLDKAGVDWRSFQNSYDWATNSGLFYFKAFQDASKDSSLYKRGLAFDGENGLEAFKKSAADGTLPEISYVFPPGALQEHSPHTPMDGAWYMNQVVSAAITGKNYNETLVMINYDEGGGWGDAVMPLVSPRGTPGEWFEDPYGKLGYTFSGPGVRIPLILISPFTRGGHVFTERADHSSMLQFLEYWLTARGYNNVTTEQLSDWRREHMSDLLNAFDFENPDYSIPDLPEPPTPIKDAKGNIVGTFNAYCSKQLSGHCSGNAYHPPIPYGKQTEEDSLFFEDGFKSVRGDLVEGHFLVLESNGYALTNLGKDDKQFTATKTTTAHEDVHQRWVVHALKEEGNEFLVSSAVDGKYLSQHSSLSISKSGAQTYKIAYMGNGDYSLQKENDKYTNIRADGTISFDSKPVGYKLYSVTYHS